MATLSSNDACSHPISRVSFRRVHSLVFSAAVCFTRFIYDILGSVSTYTLASRRNPLSRTPIYMYIYIYKYMNILAMSDKMSDGTCPVLDSDHSCCIGRIRFAWMGCQFF